MSNFHGLLEGTKIFYIAGSEVNHFVPLRMTLNPQDEFKTVLSYNFIETSLRYRQPGIHPDAAFQHVGFLVFQSGYSPWDKEQAYIGEWSLRACDRYLEDGMPPAMPLFLEMKFLLRKILKHKTCYVSNPDKSGPRCSDRILEQCRQGRMLTRDTYNPHHSHEYREKLMLIPNKLLSP